MSSKQIVPDKILVRRFRADFPTLSKHIIKYEAGSLCSFESLEQTRHSSLLSFQ